MLRQLIYIIDDVVVSGADAETLLDTTQTRNLLIDELLEVHIASFCCHFMIHWFSDTFLCTASGIPSTKNNRNEE